MLPDIDSTPINITVSWNISRFMRLFFCHRVFHRNILSVDRTSFHWWDWHFAGQWTRWISCNVPGHPGVRRQQFVINQCSVWGFCSYFVFSTLFLGLCPGIWRMWISSKFLGRSVSPVYCWLSLLHSIANQWTNIPDDRSAAREWNKNFFIR